MVIALTARPGIFVDTHPAQLAQAIPLNFIIQGEDAAIATRQVLDRVEAEAGHIGDAAHRLAVISRPGSMSRVLDDDGYRSRLTRNGADRIHVYRMTAVID